jgi:nitrate/nitrite-specific signal transduction histidine kinase
MAKVTNDANASEKKSLQHRIHSGRLFNIGTIRARLLIALILIVLLVAVAISSVTVILGSRDGRDKVTAQLQSITTLKEAEIKTWVNSLNINLNIVSSDRIVAQDIKALMQNPTGALSRFDAYGSLGDRFAWAVQSTGLFEELFLMNTDGMVIVSTDPSHEKQRHSVDDYFTEGIKSSFIQQPSYSLSLGKMTVVTSTPIVENDNTLGVLAGRASLDSLNSIMIERSGLGSTGETYLVGSNYRLLTELRDGNYPIPETYIRTQGSNSAASNHGSGTAAYLNYSGNRVIGVYKWLPDLHVTLLAEQRESEALQGTRTALINIGVVAVAAAVLAILLARFLTGSIARPLRELAYTATLISQGDLSQVASVERDDEVGTLAKAFNTMTRQLQGLFHNLEQRTVQLRAVNEVGRHISSILHVNELLEYVATSLQKTFNYHNVGIVLIDQSTKKLVLQSSAGSYEGADKQKQGEFEGDSIVSFVAHCGEALLVNNVREDPRFSLSHKEGRTAAELAVPIKVGERILGILDIEADKTDAFSEIDFSTAQTLADQLAIAIENARLYEEAQELATMKERQRLARDLHDAVSQTLFSASLIADVLPRLWERNPEEGKRRLEEIRQLTRGALAEMRTLLLELRPAALADAELSDLLKQLAVSITSRARMPVSVEIEGYCLTMSEVKVALYRIAQEALNNVAKHSGASSAYVNLICQTDDIKLIIGDDGRGFGTDNISANSLGLGIMKERAKEIGADLNIQSHEGQGTIINITWRRQAKEE